MINPLNEHYSFTQPASVFDEEAMTALELAGRQAAKINEVIKSQNDLDEATRKTLDKMNSSLDTKITEMETVLETFVEDTAPNIIEAEVQAAIQAGEFDKALANNLKNAMLNRETPTTPDADSCTSNGMFYVRSADNWQNVPGNQGGLLMCAYGESNTRFYQIFIDYNSGKLYTRCMQSGTFTEWRATADDETTVSQKWYGDGDADLNTITHAGYYVLSTNYTYQNIPEGVTAGVLIVYNDSRGTQVYQMLVSRNTGAVYVRTAYGGEFDEWRTGGVDNGAEEPTPAAVSGYEVVKISDTAFYIYQRSTRGFIRYKVEEQTNASNHLDRVIRLCGIDACDAGKNVVYTISTTGADLEGVLMIDGENDFTGGVHGNEQKSFVTSRGIILGASAPVADITGITDGIYHRIELVIPTSLYKAANQHNPVFTRFKRLVFENGYVQIHNKLTCMSANENIHFRGVMLNVNKDCFTHHWLNFGAPIQRAEIGLAAENVEETGGEVTGWSVSGGIYAHVEAETRNGEDIRKKVLVQDYGDRVKAYFFSHMGVTTEMGNIIHTVGKITIDY